MPGRLHSITGFYGAVISFTARAQYPVISRELEAQYDSATWPQSLIQIMVK